MKEKTSHSMSGDTEGETDWLKSETKVLTGKLCNPVSSNELSHCLQMKKEHNLYF